MKNALIWGLGAGLVLLVAVVGWQLAGSSYKSDVTALCDAEKLSGTTFEKNNQGLSSWMSAHVKTPEGSALNNDLSNLGLEARGQKLAAEASRLGITSCPLADMYKSAQTQSDYRRDLSQLCTGDGTSIEFVSDADRMEKVRVWAASRPRSPKTTAFLEKFYAASPADRPAMLSAEARANTVFSCQYADLLGKPPVPPGPGGPHVKPGPPQIQGSLPASTWATLLDSVLPTVKDCYDTEVRKEHEKSDAGTAHGHVTVRAEIDPSGKVGKAQVGPIEQTEIDACVQQAFADKPFPAAKGFKGLVLQPIDFLP